MDRPNPIIWQENVFGISPIKFSAHAAHEGRYFLPWHQGGGGTIRHDSYTFNSQYSREGNGGGKPLTCEYFRPVDAYRLHFH